MARTVRASFQLMMRSKILAPRMRNAEEIIDAIDCATNPFTESTSDVRFVRSFEGVAHWM
jgi:hypothetical protein